MFIYSFIMYTLFSGIKWSFVREDFVREYEKHPVFQPMLYGEVSVYNIDALRDDTLSDGN